MRYDRPPTDLQRLVTISEVETMRVMRRHGLKVPDAFLTPSHNQAMSADPGEGVSIVSTYCQRLTGVGPTVNYFFTELCDGTSWILSDTPLSIGEKSISQVTAFITDLACFQAHLSEITFDSIGSLHPSSNGEGSHVGPLLTFNAFNRSKPPYFFGPFKTNGARYVAHLDVLLSLIENGSLFGEDPTTAFLVYLWTMKLVVEGNESLAIEHTQHYIKHADDKGDQFLADEDDYIVALIDWEW